MRIQGLAVVGVLVAVLLTACSMPERYAFLREEISSEDVLPDDVREQVGIDAETVRHQGQYDGVDVFLALAGHGVQVVLIGDDPSEWVAGGSERDSRVSVGGLVGVDATYHPEGVDEPSEGWTELSEWVEVRS